MITYETKDNEGNAVQIEDRTKIYLHLKGESERRCLGVINQGYLRIHRKRSVHLWKGSYGFNHYILSQGKTFDKLWLIDEFGQYVIPVNDILAYGVSRQNRSRFEKQIYIPIKTIEKYVIDKKI